MRFSFAAYLFAVLLAAAGCSDEKADVSGQTTRIENYIDRLVAADESIPHDVRRGVYRLWERVGTGAEAVKGGTVEFDFEAGTFPYSFNSIFYTNRGRMIDSLWRNSLAMAGAPSLDTTHWSRSPVVAPVGGGRMVEGVKRGLVGCRAGDDVVLIFTSELGFGGSEYLKVPANSSQMWKIHIISVR